MQIKIIKVQMSRPFITVNKKNPLTEVYLVIYIKPLPEQRQVILILLGLFNLGFELFSFILERFDR